MVLRFFIRLSIKELLDSSLPNHDEKCEKTCLLEMLKQFEKP